jgi:aspartyl-tRNA(Asn)/glutamyl-tRNA(Gln) amidotransferase subunit C
MEINEDTIRHIAKLSRIELDSKLIEPFCRQFSDILKHFDKLNDLNTDNVEPLTQAVEIFNVFKDDTSGASLSIEKALENAPDSSTEFFRVPKVLGDSQ